MKGLRRIAALLLVLALLPLAGMTESAIRLLAQDYPVTRSGWYTSLEEVSVYIAAYQKLPGNYITKSRAERLGWLASAGNLWQVAAGKSIGGDRFENYEGQLPDAKGRTWRECDIDYAGGYRGGKRVLFSSDGLIYYTGDHYNHFRRVLVSFETPTPQPAVALPTFALPTVALPTPAPEPLTVEENGLYTDKEHVALYLHEFWGLPANYITKSEARELGWSAKKDNLPEVAPGYAIGGDEFGNREGLLPSTATRTWYECDVNGTDGRRSRQRLVFSSDGLIYYTEDGFQSFELLYGGEEP